MLSILICDDETNICSLIRNLIEWETLDMSLAGIVHSGTEALDFICKHQPDIVITDIRMPDFDGLHLIGKVRECGFSTQFIIISGYQHFEYAHDALHYGIADYLLKPINGEELNNALAMIKKRVISEQQQQLAHDTLVRELSHAISKIEEHQVKSIFFDAQLPPLSSLKNGNSGLDFTADTFCTCIVRYDVPMFEEFISTNIEHAIEKTVHFIRNSLGQPFRDFVCCSQYNSIFCVFNYDHNDTAGIKLALDTILFSARRYADGFNGVSVTIGVGAPVNSYEELHTSIAASLKSVNARIVYGTNRIIYYTHFDQQTKADYAFSNEEKNRISGFIEACNTNELSSHLYTLLDLTSGKGYAAYVPYDLVRNVFQIFCQTAQKNGYINLDIAAATADFDYRMNFVWNTRQLHALLMGCIEKYYDELRQKSEYAIQKPIQLAVQYIQENLDKECSLQEVANVVHLNPSYLSSLFKQNIGQGFNTYVTQVRMDMAKKMLRSGELQIQEIAQKLGYKDLKHFRSLFKKVVGIMPSKYRELYK